ncbi:E3 ubiquitin-protein ligase TRIM7-like [Mobula birostris]|uniref:E3 ubiquitin-protein ligase TRIM7-like n=1 Tax=Mobula birostris TaxID=1983395 RepID=UPI003B28417C
MEGAEAPREPEPESECAVCRSPCPDAGRLCSECGRYFGTELRTEVECPRGHSDPGTPAGAEAPSAPEAQLPAAGGQPREVDGDRGLCSEHGRPLQFYCEEDGECVCGPCTATGRHTVHTLVSLETARANIKEKLKKEVENLRIIQQNCHFKQQDVALSESDVKTQVGQLKGNLSKKFAEWRRSLEADEECALKAIDQEGEKVLAESSRSFEELVERMDRIRLIDNETRSLVQSGPLPFIQGSSQLLLKIAEEQKKAVPDVPRLVLNLYSAPEAIRKRLKNSFTYHSAILGTTDQWSSLTLDPDSAYWLLNVSEDEKTVMFGYMGENSWHNSKMFENMHQILCAQSFTAGCHSWDLKTGGVAWGVGVAYGSIDRGGLQSHFTNSAKSWCLYLYRGALTACHRNQQTYLREFPAVSRIRVQLDYEGGTVSFYQVGDCPRHLYTFQTTFTEPVFPAFSCSGNSSLKLLC